MTTMAAFSSWSTTRSNTACGRSSPMFQPAGGWFTAKPTGLRVWTTSNRTGPIFGRGVCARGWPGAAGLSISKRRGRGSRMELDDRALPLTRGQLDIWLAQETGQSGTEWQLGLFVRIEGPVERGRLEWAIRRVVREAEPLRAAIFEVDGQVFQKPIDYPDVELAFYDLSGSDHAVPEAHEIALSIQRTPMPFTGPLFKFALFRTGLDEFYLFACGHHIVIDGSGLLLVGHRIAAVYSAI